MEGEISLKHAVDEYREIYLAYRNFAQRTREEYVNDLEDLVEFLGGMGIKNLREVNLPHLVRYMAELDKRGFAGSTRKRKAISIKSFFNFLYMEGYTVTNVGKQLILPYVEAREPRYLTSEEYNRLLECAKPNKRDYAIIQILLQTGIKLSELTRLTLNDLEITDVPDEKGHRIEYIRIVGNQRNKERIIPLNPKASSAIRDYLSIRQVSPGNKLFLNKMGIGMGERGVEKALVKYFKLAGITNASVNSLRHTFGLFHATKGVSIKTLQKVMGHKEIKTTGKYFSIINEYQAW